MGFGSLLKMVEGKAKEEAQKYLNKDKEKASDATPPKSDPDNPPTRWEKAVFAMNVSVADAAQRHFLGLLC
jgi:hypothetical protein